MLILMQIWLLNSVFWKSLRWWRWRGCVGHVWVVWCTALHCSVKFRLVHCREGRLEVKWSTNLPGSIQRTPTSYSDSWKLTKISWWILSASASHGKSLGLLVHWVVPAVLYNMIRLIANEATPGLELSASICRLNTRLRGIKVFVLFFFFLC